MLHTACRLGGNRHRGAKFDGKACRLHMANPAGYYKTGYRFLQPHYFPFFIHSTGNGTSTTRRRWLYRSCLQRLSGAITLLIRVVRWPARYTGIFMQNRPGTSSYPPRSPSGRKTAQNKKARNSGRCRDFGLWSADDTYSHSMVPMGFGVRSSRTRLIPSTSWVMR